MFLGRSGGLPVYSSLNDVLQPDLELEADEDEEADSSSRIIYTASFDELAGNYIQYETIIWLSISLLLVLAWGIGVIMLLYLPFKRYVLQKDISSRKLYVTPAEIIYKVSRPSFIPCWKTVTLETRVPLSLVIDIIIEQGCLESVYGIHTLRVESISRGKAAPVDELQVQGLSNPGLLQKVIITEASKAIRDADNVMTRMSSLNKRLASLRPPSMKWKADNSSYPVSSEHRGITSGELLFLKIDEMDRSVKKLESLINKSPNPPKSTERCEDVTLSS
ncbi:uncharacterized protein LOC104888524 isoform X1 [Beta vulgaris subsp. vulgaris]|uniref:uncharacterized protein LOC104888524 isoform X1 n=1 Tax=Beta vulgaris subsp. vulgaris TaxID=3555 RepID=UPI002036A25B|nr:uncharacterized protein LOC104888524 isoform X1 [Beta vulgaris subsp. vulgaris]XP_057251130.1 uncharacterized protein LOC104888524 isoform X1 [Beta vulgaris subsp. vulgaris]